MVTILIRWMVLTLSIIIASYFLDGIHVRDFFSAFLAAAVLGVLNVLLRPILIILTLPITIFSLGLFMFVINAFLLAMVSGVIPGFEVHGFWTAVFGALIISIINWLLSSFIIQRGRIQRVDYVDLKKKGDRWE
ncbi:MAG TPA: phage holin family protein [Deltaproteobacteria bacterium]|nr:phage holin family protein [Deltaproteobacteria bacterium]